MNPHPFRTILSTAPIRICDIGGWTDTAVARHGRVFNIAVCPLAEVSLAVFRRGTRDAPVVIDAENYAQRYAPDLAGPGRGAHPLLEAALQEIPPPPDVDLEVKVRCGAPAGASTGTSAAVVVALLGALEEAAGTRRPALDLAYRAHAVETTRLGRQSGIQDQICSALGGVNFIDIAEYPRASVTPLHPGEPFLRELDRRLAVIYLGRAHSSSEVHELVMGDLARHGPEWAPLQRLRAFAERARDAVLANDFKGLGDAMRENTEAQADLHPDLVHEDAWRIIEIAAAHDAAGWKVNGAGGDGGSLTLLADDPASRDAMVQDILQALARCTHIPHAFSPQGLRVSSARSSQTR